MKIIISTPNINLNISKVVGTFKKLNYLESFWTTIIFPFKTNFFKKDIIKKLNINLLN